MSEIIHPNTFEELKATLGEDFVVELVDTYCTEIPTLLDQLQLADDQNDPVTFQRAAHSIKSSSASLGAMDFSTQAKELEMIGKSGDLSGVGPKVNALRQSYQSVEQALHTLVS